MYNFFTLIVDDLEADKQIWSPRVSHFHFRQEHQRHAKDVHDGDMPIKCGLCPKAFDTIQRQRIHRRDDHFKPAGKSSVLVFNNIGV